ncbi:MAG: hypothetical protein ABJD97_11510, partial [Betaproteobacteria bacterium]
MPGNPTLLSFGEAPVAPRRSARRAIAVLYRQAGLIALCALVGWVASLWLAQHEPRVHVTTAKAWMRARLPGLHDSRQAAIPLVAPPMRDDVRAAAAVAAREIGLKLDLDPGAAVGEGTPPVLALETTPPLRRDVAHPLAADDASDVRLGNLDQFDRLLRLEPAAAGRRAVVDAFDSPPPAAGGREPGVGLLGPVAGLLLGLLLAGLRELGSDRMRSVREAEWALGVPVLGGIPTLSAKARLGY